MPPAGSSHLLQLLLYALAGLVGGLLALRTGIPAAPLAGALLGAALARRRQLAAGHAHRPGDRHRHRDRHLADRSGVA
jgi:uncharacterized membrane protein AbrB (regulator of aidB expression)